MMITYFGFEWVYTVPADDLTQNLLAVATTKNRSGVSSSLCFSLRACVDRVLACASQKFEVASLSLRCRITPLDVAGLCPLSDKRSITSIDQHEKVY